jgi:aspartate/methionine/tyrosine aminotransferase
VLPEGAYHILADISAFDLGDDVTFAHYLASEIGVAAVPGSNFYKNPEMGASTVRFTFSKSDETLLEAVSRLKNL